MKKFQLLVLMAFSILAFSSCNVSKEEKKAFDMGKAKADIQAIEDAFAAAEKKRDAKAVAEYYSDDAISYGRNEGPISGRAAIEEAIGKRMASDSSGNYNVYKVVDIFGDDDMLVEIGSWTVMNAAGAAQEKGHYMSCFKKLDGKYVCVRDMNVTSTPAKPAM